MTSKLTELQRNSSRSKERVKSLLIVPTWAVLILLASCADQIGGQVEVEVGDSRSVSVSTHCDLSTLTLDVNGSSWTSDNFPKDDVGNPLEPAWPSDAVIELEITLIDLETLRVTAPGTGVSHIYHPDPDPPGCA